MQAAHAHAQRASARARARVHAHTYAHIRPLRMGQSSNTLQRRITTHYISSYTCLEEGIPAKRCGRRQAVGFRRSAAKRTTQEPPHLFSWSARPYALVIFFVHTQYNAARYLRLRRPFTPTTDKESNEKDKYYRIYTRRTPHYSRCKVVWVLARCCPGPFPPVF